MTAVEDTARTHTTDDLLECPEAAAFAGKPVKLLGLQQRPELNGKGADVLGSASAKRLRVVLREDGRELSLSPLNVRIDADRFVRTRVDLYGFVSRPELNGASGRVESVDAENGLCVVRVDGMDMLQSISLSNLRIQTRGAPAAARDRDQEVFKQADVELTRGKELALQGRYHEAILQYEQCRRYAELVSRAESKLNIEGVVSGNIGNAYSNLGENELALDYHTRALGISKQIGHRQGEGSDHLALGNVHYSLGQYELAIKHHTDALAIRQEMKDRGAEGDILGNLGNVYDSKGQYELAIEHYEEALAISQAREDRRAEANHLGNLGVVYRHCGLYKRSIDLHTQALAINKDRKDRRGEASDLGNLGNVYDCLGQYKLAIDYHKEALAICKKTNDRRGEGCHLGNLGNAYVSLGQHKSAINHYTEALAISQAMQDRRGEGTRLGNLGSVYFGLGQYKKAIDFHEKALAISEEIKDRRGQASDLSSLGSAYNSRGQYEVAIERITQALSINREIGNRAGEGSVLGILAISYLSLGKYERAKKHLTEALAINKEIGNRQGVGDTFGNLGNIYLSLGQYELALKHYKQALVISKDISDRRGEGSDLGNIGSTYSNLGQHELAIEHLTQALTISRETGQAAEVSTLSNLGSAYNRLGQHERAIEHYEQALAISKEIRDRPGEGRELGNLGSTYLRLGQHPAAVKHLSAACHLFDQLWAALDDDGDRVTFGDTDGPVISNLGLQCALVEAGDPMKALEAAERAHARSLERELAAQRLNAENRSPAVPSTADSAPSSAAESAFPPNTDRADAERMRAFAMQRRTAIVIFSQVTPVSIFSWVVSSDGSLTFHRLVIPARDTSLSQLTELTRRRIGARARTNESAVPPTLRSGSDALLDTPAVDEEQLARDLRGAPVPAANDGVLHDRLLTWVQGLLDKWFNGMHPLLHRCYEVLIAPLERALEGEEKLLLVPDRDLYALPFAALLNTDGKHLIERFVLCVAPSVETVIMLDRQVRGRKGSPTSRTALVVGSPYYHTWARELKKARKEADDVAEMLTSTAEFRAVHKLTQTDATKEAVVSKMPSSEVIHLAAHGEPDGLLLSAPTQDEGKLSMGEVQALKLPYARLVVLSACDTFRGELRTDGVIGISRSFMRAGALVVVASLWQVGDTATHELMARFYKRLFMEANGDPAIAMQGAMVSMLRDPKASFRWPHSWAAFVVYGLPACK